MENGSRYDAVFLDVDGTLTWVDVDVEGYVRELSGYANGSLSAEAARGPVWRSVKTHIRENINYPDADALRAFKRKNALATAGELGISAPEDLLAAVADRRILFRPFPEAEPVLQELKDLGLPLYIVSNWDVLLEEVLEGLGWTHYFDGVVASAAVGSEKPEAGIFQAALRLSGTEPSRTVHVGNDASADIEGARRAGLDSFFVDRKGEGNPARATYAAPDLTSLPGVLRR
ncbi:HAD-SF-IA-v3: HAD hydrolase, family IA, variant 3 [Rubrobacter radiotolerans]|uniref:HAD family hydrolase n=1 Tax=Rubrobacter radiotolerans TaxID=42256 RepID=A0A023X261_RUBRA|nr:HAD family hydrolase [Rubrobacter radiotolerans]AHY46443.1 HAD-SF-IA-v3: HAD hydrolase, family IA, variant 3 [Rubrobacter radiotolerans]MDX5893850.1 HAD family hydrolase [Rubrobacter radiotolerans]SMC04616.1 putative hydrolase of the HAD superfamily [Rubrobacter radiotolerans DSM 5868]